MAWHDVGHAIAAVSIAAGLAGWRATLLPAWPHRAIAAATGISRDEDFVEAEREDPACIMAMTVAAPFDCSRDTAERLAAAISRGQWSGRASQLSEDHVEWSFIDEIARATQDEGRDRSKGSEGPRGPRGPRGRG